MAAWLLLLLRDGESYGRALFTRLSERGIGVETAFSYRTLRALEGDGAIASRWTESHHGPQRRSYRLTSKGRRLLAEHAACIAATLQLYDMFVRAYAGGGRAAPEHPADPPAPSPDGGSTVSRELLMAWLLLLLRDGESHGYGLRRAIEQRHIRADSGAMYRALQTLDADGSLQSRWGPSTAGPQRRSYQLATRGRRRLDELAESIDATREKYAAFVEAFEIGARASAVSGRFRHPTG